MKVTYECLPCLIRESIKVSKLVTNDMNLQQKIIKNTLQKISKLDFSETAPYLGRIIHKYAKEVSNIADPYKKLKIESNKIALQICEDLNITDLIHTSKFPIDTACRLAIAGNIIDFSVYDFSVYDSINEEKIRETIEDCLQTKIKGNSSEELLKAVNNANKILYLADNSGEIVFDKLLINELPKEKITYVVKGEPIANDATIDDALDIGMKNLVRVIDNGSDAQGTIFDLCSYKFIKEFEEADLIISKGQSNYETLSQIQGKKIFFLLKAKCKVIANNLGCLQGDLVMKSIE